mmetsp:Transcript_18620/g.41306  ORF Transcript_18620/g.41306 Transcript_18620/m.41306 type:complete len:286 (+) Transcript_18620:1049-1906(+)
MVEPESKRMCTLSWLPRVGLGTFKLRGDACTDVVLSALKAGYRSIDTASVYRNEEAVAQGLLKSGIPRSEVFITTKIKPQDQGEQAAYDAAKASLERLGCQYVDLLLIHWPGAAKTGRGSDANRQKRHGSWLALQRLQQEGLARHIGVSNFLIPHLEQLVGDPAVVLVPEVNQIEVHPRFQQRELREWCNGHGILVQAYASLGTGLLLGDECVTRIAKSANATPAQVLLAWGLARSAAVIPKASSEVRVVENLGCVDLALEPEALDDLDNLDGGTKICWDPDGIA